MQRDLQRPATTGTDDKIEAFENMLRPFA